MAATITSAIAGRIAPLKPELFVKIPVTPRLKDDGSMITKAFVRKRYDHPWEQVEDKVGVRFVVLLSDDIRVVEKTIVGDMVHWEATKAKDFEAERAQRPLEFSYQSLHYVVYSKLGNTWNGVEIPESIPCEIQIRTLMQHAYSELTHDTIYKPSVRVTAEMERAAAKSMALIEATDDYFMQVAGIIRKAEAAYRTVADALDVHYLASVGQGAEHGALDTLLVDRYRHLVNDDFPQALEQFLIAKPFIGVKIGQRRVDYEVFRLSSILLLYYCASKFPAQTKDESPLSDDELALVYSDLGL